MIDRLSGRMLIEPPTAGAGCALTPRRTVETRPEPAVAQP
jgi:hypothetical protein